MIILLPNISGDNLGRLDKVVIIAASLLLAALTKTHVEDRFRRQRSRSLKPTFAFAALGMAILVALSVLQITEVDRHQVTAQEKLQKALSGGQECFGANALAPGADCKIADSGPVVPAPAQAVDDRSDAYDKDCPEYGPFSGTASCVYGDPDGDISIALVGNSHAVHWLPAIDRVAKQSHWKITTYFALACGPSYARSQWPKRSNNEQGCFDWGQRVLANVAKKNFELVVMSASNGGLAKGAKDPGQSQRIWESGYRKYLGQLTADGTHVAVIRDVPFPGTTIKSIPDCIAVHRDDLLNCSAKRSVWVRDDPLAAAALQLGSKRVDVVDLNNYFCTDKVCPGVIGGVIVYFDAHHLTKTYSETLAPFLAKPLGRAVSAATAG